MVAGKQLGPYSVVELLGAGGMGEVYRARDPRLGREVAIKVLPAGLADQDRLDRFEQEARAAGALNHPNILSVFDAGQVEGAPYVVSELLEGETLRTALRNGAISLRKVIDYARQIAAGLAAAHEKGIVHRDLKPENLFVTKDGRIKILDFGLAKLMRQEMAPGQTNAPTISADSDPGMLLGTVGYMAPEQVRGKSADHRSDLFSFGCVLYEMLTGQRPFHRESAAETLSAILKEEPPEIPAERKVPPALARIVEHCLEKDPDHRFQSTRDLGFDLEALTAASSSAMARPAMGREWLRLTPAVAGILIVVAAAMGFLAGGWREKKPQPPIFHQVTYARGPLIRARFAPDGNTMLYSAAWEGRPMQLYASLPNSFEATALSGPDVWLLSTSSKGELAVLLHASFGSVNKGTLATMPLGGGAPREILDDVVDADWTPDGSKMAVVHEAGGRTRLEYPIGKVLYETTGGISSLRFSPKGDLLAFLDHPVALDDRGTVAVIDLSGKKTTLSPEYLTELGLAWSADGREIWYSAGNETNRHLNATNLSGKTRVVMRMPGGLILHDIAASGRVLLTRETDRCGTRGLAPGETKERELSIMNWSFAAELSRDGKKLLLGEEGHGPYNVYLRPTDGSPAVKLGEGLPMSLSPDGKWALATNLTTTPQVLRLPTGPGEAQTVTRDAINHFVAKYLPDGRRFVFCGDEAGKGRRLYVQEIEGGQPRAISPEGVCGTGQMAVSSDGRWVAVDGPDQKPILYPVEGGPPRVIPKRSAGEAAIQISADGKSLFVGRPGDVPARIRQVDIATGQEKAWKTLSPMDPAGLVGIAYTSVTPDGRTYAYTYCTYFSELYLVEGMR